MATWPRQGRAGQRVGILASNTPALVAGMFAAWRLGARGSAAQRALARV